VAARVTDEPEYLDYDKYAQVVRYVDALATRVGDLHHRAVVDKPRPDPRRRASSNELVREWPVNVKR
jgi:hypothetical protein